MIRRDLWTGNWKAYLDRALTLRPCYQGGIDGGKVTIFLLGFLMVKIISFSPSPMKVLLLFSCFICKKERFFVFFLLE